MLIRHCVEERNVGENLIIKNAKLIRHVIVQGGKIQSMSGYIDPKSHLNLDYTLHHVTECIIAKKFEIGANLILGSNGFIFAAVSKSDFDHYGKVDYTKKLLEMINSVKALKAGPSYNSVKDPPM